MAILLGIYPILVLEPRDPTGKSHGSPCCGPSNIAHVPKNLDSHDLTVLVRAARATTFCFFLRENDDKPLGVSVFTCGNGMICYCKVEK